MGAEKASRSIAWILLGVLVFYRVGVLVRHACGVRFEITNNSGATVQDVSLGFDRLNYRDRIPVGEIAPGKTRSLFSGPKMKFSYFMNFTDAQGVRHTRQGETDIPEDDSADVKIRILPSGNVEMDLPTHHLISWESWCGFL